MKRLYSFNECPHCAGRLELGLRLSENEMVVYFECSVDICRSANGAFRYEKEILPTQLRVDKLPF